MRTRSAWRRAETNDSLEVELALDREFAPEKLITVSFVNGPGCSESASSVVNGVE